MHNKYLRKLGEVQSRKMQSHEGRVGMKVCVTRAVAYIGSWLVKNLLQRGYTVISTLKNPIM